MGFSTSKQYFYKKTLLVIDNNDQAYDCEDDLSEHTVLSICRDFFEGYQKITPESTNFCIFGFSFDKKEKNDFFTKNKITREYSSKNILLCKRVSLPSDNRNNISAYIDTVKKAEKENFGLLLAQKAYKLGIPYIVVPTDLWDFKLIKGFINLLIEQKYINSTAQGMTNIYLPKNVPYEWRDIYYCLSDRFVEIKEKGGYKIFDFFI